MKLRARLLLALIASVTGWLGSGTQLAFGDSTSPPVVHVYDIQHHNAVAPCTITERGPPNATYDYTTYDAVDRWSPGASARSGDATTPSIYDYDDTARFVRTTGGSHGVEWPTSTDKAGFAVVQRSTVAAKTGDEAFHYTSSKWIESITTNGLNKGAYATPNGSLSPLQASLELALPPNRALPDAALRIDLAGLRKAGYDIPLPTRVSSTVSHGGRTYSMPGGGYEMQFPYAIPPEFIKVVPR